MGCCIADLSVTADMYGNDHAGVDDDDLYAMVRLRYISAVHIVFSPCWLQRHYVLQLYGEDAPNKSPVKAVPAAPLLKQEAGIDDDAYQAQLAGQRWSFATAD